MKKKTHLVVFALGAAALATLLTLVARTGYGQSQMNEQAGAVAGTALRPGATRAEVSPAGATPKTDAATAGGADASLTSAAARNALLKYELNWAFGGKQQRGWYLYTPLISRLLSTDGDAGAGEFTSALAGWQKTAGLQPNGVLDDETLYRMVSEWQGARLKNKEYARPDELLVAPAADFYDSSRPEELRQVERETYAAYKRMVAAAAADPSLNLRRTASGELAPEERFLKIVSSFRSREYQANLRRQSPNSGRAGLAVNSPHFTGRALDIYVGGEPVETKDSNRAVQVRTAVYLWLVKNADRFGFRPYYYEPWHWEYVGGGAVANRQAPR